MNAQAKTPAQQFAADVEALAAQCGVDAKTVQLAAEGVARRLVALFGGAQLAAEAMTDATVRAALQHYTASVQQIGAQLAADPAPILDRLRPGQ